MRVAVNAEQLLYRSPGGIGRYTAQLLTVLPALFPADVVLPFTARHPRRAVADALAAAGVAPEVAARATVLGLPRPLLYDGWVGIGWPRLPPLGEAEVVHAPSVAVPPRGRVPLVVTVHDAAPALFPEAFPPRGRRFHHRGLVAAARRADAVITVSHAAADEIAAHSAIAPDRIRVVPNGVDPPVVDPHRQRSVLGDLGLLDQRYVLWIGSLEPRKGVGTLVAAMGRLARRGRGEQPLLVLAGFPGWRNDSVVDRADVDALGDRLRHVGTVDEETLWALLGGATVFAFPSRHEGFGLPVLEAMSQGVAVVASDIPALRELAGGAARLVPATDVDAWADAVHELLDDDGRRRQLGEAGLARSHAFGVEHMARGVHAVYEEVTGA